MAGAISFKSVVRGKLQIRSRIRRLALSHRQAPAHCDTTMPSKPRTLFSLFSRTSQSSAEPQFEPTTYTINSDSDFSIDSELNAHRKKKESESRTLRSTIDLAVSIRSLRRHSERSLYDRLMGYVNTPVSADLKMLADMCEKLVDVAK